MGLFVVNNCCAQPTAGYDEVEVLINVQHVGETELPALVRDQTIYLPIGNLFDFLRIKNTVSAKMDSVSGFFINPQANYVIDKPHNHIVYSDKIYDVKPGDLISTPTGLYLQSDYFGKIFGLTCAFSFRSLSVMLSTTLELPVVREMRLEQTRTNLNRLNGVVKADTIVGRTYPLLHFGMADYQAVTTINNRPGPRDARVSLSLGGVIAGGETDVVVNYHSTEAFIERNQYYLWRLANNDNLFAKQFMLGKIYGQSIASIYSPIVGAQLTNAPTTYKKSFGTYTISDYTEPDWTVELYVNNILITYVKANAAGFYSFKVPLIYGNTVVKLRFYGPYGEEKSSEKYISIPFIFMPKGEFEYVASAGMVEDGHESRFGRFSGNYGLSSGITIGGGAEYLSSITSGASIPFVNTSVRIFSNLLFSGEYDHGVQSKALLSYNLPSGMQLGVNDTWYHKGQTAVNNTYLEDRKANFSIPFRTHNFSGFSMLTLEQIVLPVTKYTTGQWLLSGTFGNFNTNVNTYALVTDGNSPYVNSTFTVAARLPKNILLTQQMQYEYFSKQVVEVKTEFKKILRGNGYIDVFYERNFTSNITNIQAGLTYYFSFAQMGSTVTKSNNVVSYIQSVSGSLIHDSKSHYNNFNNRTNVGKGAVILVPFLDLNGNGRRDAGEPKVPGLAVRVNGGRVAQSDKDTTIRITDLEAYVNCIIELDASGLDRVAWQLRKKNYSVAIDPNLVKTIEVPISVFGEASGRVIIKNNGEESGMGRLIINFYNNRSVKIAHTMTEADGYFSYLGLLPGNYSAQIDTAQSAKLNLVSIPGVLPFTIIRNNEGTVVDGLDFEVKAAGEPAIENLVIPEIKIKTPVLINDNITIAPAITGKGITIQTAHFKYHNALAAVAVLTKYNYKAIMVRADRGYFNIRITGIEDRNKAKGIIRKLKYIGFPDAYILNESF
jgi:hypothetical protein